MQGSEAQDVVKRLSRLFLRYPSMRLPDEQLEATMAAYAADLVKYPLWAIDTACKRFIAGMEDGSKVFVPSSAQLAIACDSALAGFRVELKKLDQVLNADVYREPSAEERAKVRAEFQKLVEELQLNMDPRDKAPERSRPMTKAEAEAALERALINPLPAPQLSDELRARLGLTTPESKGEAA